PRREVPAAVAQRARGVSVPSSTGPGDSSFGEDRFSDGSSTGRNNEPFDGRESTWLEPRTVAEGNFLADYEILEERGRGGMGVVYKAQHRRMKRVVALKVIHKEHLSRPSAIQRFYREIQAASQLSHRNIVLAYDAGEIDGTHFFAMEFVEGLDLNHLLRNHGPLPIRVACSYVAQVALGLAHAHQQGLVHRDIKPSNLLATWRDQPTVPEPPLDSATIKILDFG